MNVDGGRIVETSIGGLQVLDEGDPKGPPIVLIHCYTCSLHWRDRLAPRLTGAPPGDPNRPFGPRTVGNDPHMGSEEVEKQAPHRDPLPSEDPAPAQPHHPTPSPDPAEGPPTPDRPPTPDERDPGVEQRAPKGGVRSEGRERREKGRERVRVLVAQIADGRVTSVSHG